MLDAIPLDIPFMLLSTKVNNTGETEKRVLTPFGILDVIFRGRSTSKTHMPYFEIEVNGDTDNWVSYDYVIWEFKTTFIQFVLGIVQRHWGKEARNSLKEVSVHTKGGHLKIRVSWPEGS